MATSRYAYTSKILGRKQLATSESQIYGSSDLWWILAAASGIGWALQVPPGTVVKVPTALNRVFDLIR